MTVPVTYMYIYARRPPNKNKKTFYFIFIRGYIYIYFFLNRFPLEISGYLVVWDWKLTGNFVWLFDPSPGETYA